MPEPYYQQDGITIYHGDCRDVLPSLSEVCVVIADPPYGCKRPSQRTAYWRGKIDDIAGNHCIDPSWLDIIRVRNQGAVYVFTSWDVLGQWKSAMEQRWHVRSCIVWDKVSHGLADLKTCWAPRHELILFAGVGRHELRGQRPVDIVSIPRSNTTSHPYEKPVGLIRLLMSVSDPATVLDPFMGSGTTLVAAKLEGRQAIGIEIEERYCEIAANRLRQGVLDFGD